MAILTPGQVDYHLASQTGTFSQSALAPVSLVAWINAPWTAGRRVSMVGTYNTATSGGTAIQIGTSTGAGECSIWTWGGTVLVNSTGGTTPTLTPGAWYHVAYTFDGTTHQLYINGVFCNSATTAQLAGTITAIFINGYPGGGTAETAAYYVDDVSYYSRTLSADEIITLYTSSGDRDGIRYGCIANILFSEGTPGSIANNCIDYSQGANNLTPLGAATSVSFTYSTSAASLDTRPPLG